MQVKLYAIARPLEDLNENRLSKFEFALLITKIMEDFLSSDIQYNFVQHFRSSDPQNDELLLPNGLPPALVMPRQLLVVPLCCGNAMLRLR